MRDPRATAADLTDDDLLPDHVARQVLARASDLDAHRPRGATVAELRAAATEAGIAAPAFDTALAEWRDAVGPSLGRGRVPRHRSWATAMCAGLVAAGAFVAGRAGVPAHSPRGGVPSVVPVTADVRVDVVGASRSSTVVGPANVGRVFSARRRALADAQQAQEAEVQTLRVPAGVVGDLTAARRQALAQAQQAIDARDVQVTGPAGMETRARPAGRW